MNATPAPFIARSGDYAMNFPQERDGDRKTARDVMKRNGCRSIRFEKLDNGVLVAHGYIGPMSGPGVEDL
jgi:nitrous oxide reductase accessory protein NosL